MVSAPKDKRVTNATALINARLLDPESGRNEAGGLLIEDSTIADLGPHLRRNAPTGATVIDCRGNLVIPGLIDMQVFTGEPGLEHRETLASAARAAAAGGVTTMICMPPPIRSSTTWRWSISCSGAPAIPRSYMSTPWLR